MRRSSLRRSRRSSGSRPTSYSVIEVLKRYPRGVFTAMGLRFAENIMYYLVVTFSITYLKVQVGADTSDDPAGGCWSRMRCTSRSSRWSGGCPTASGGARSTWSARSSARHLGILRLPDDEQRQLPASSSAAIIIGLVIHAFMYAPQPAIMAEMFPTRMRYSGVSLGYQVTSIVAGSLAPIIAVKLLDIYDSSVPIAIYLAVACGVTLIAVLFTRETNGIDLEYARHADARTGSRGQGGRRMSDLDGRTALVTGGASGIGAACARELARRGAVGHGRRHRRRRREVAGAARSAETPGL